MIESAQKDKSVASYKEGLKQVLRISFYCAGGCAVLGPLSLGIASRFSIPVDSDWPIYLVASLLGGCLMGFSLGFVFGLIYKLYEFAFKREAS